MTKQQHKNLDISYIPVDFNPFADGELLSFFPSTESQKEIWVSAQMSDEANKAYNESVTVSVHGPFDIDIIKLACQDLIKRYDILRATFSSDGQSICLHPPRELQIPFKDISEFNEREKEKKFQMVLEQVVQKPFDLEHGPLLNIQIFKFNNNLFHIIITVHHIICDGWSMDVLVKDLSIIYSKKKNGETVVFDAPDRFSDYAALLAKQINSPETKAAETYWLEKFSGQIPTLDLPIDKPRPTIRSFNAAREDKEISQSLINNLKKVAAASNCTFVTILLAGFKVFLYRLTQQNNLVVGLATSGQSSVGKENLVGHCVNLLPIKSNVTGEQTFKDYLLSLRAVLFDAYDYQQYTFGSLIKRLRLSRDRSRIPLIPVMFNIDQGIDVQDIRFGGYEVDFFSNPRLFETFEMFVNIAPKKGRYVIECQYNTDLFEAKTIQRRLEEFVTLLQGIVDNSDQTLSELPVLPEAEKRLISSGWNKITPEDTRNECIHQLFEKQADRFPDRVCVVFENEQLTYRDLNQKSNKLAQYLTSIGVGPNSLVGICVERSTDMMIGLLGILKAGGAYVPLDPEYPTERLSYMMNDAKVSVLLTHSYLRDLIPDHEARIVCLDTDWEAVSSLTIEKPIDMGTPENPAYVTYTSGSTGKPKGVKVPHKAVVNFLVSMSRRPGMTEDDAILAVTTLSFDIHVLELYLPLIVGGKTVLVSRDVASDGARLTEALGNFNITIMQATPSTWRVLLTAGWKGSDKLKILCGGEAFPKDLVKELIERSASVWNMYGPTETTVWSTCYELKDTEGPVLIGKPIENTQVYVLDKHMQQVPIGVPGELYIGGAGVADGYLNQPDLTKKQFVSNPLGPDNNDIVYKTGDIVRYRNDGNLEYFNRIDSQVKVRGFRIELGEIETVIKEYGKIEQGIVIVKEVRPGDTRLIAHFSSTEEENINVPELKRFLQAKLPQYMIPQYFVQIDTPFSLTPAGKIDKKVLPDPTIDDGNNNDEFILPKDEVESQLVEIWKQILDINKVSTNQDFFDLGGHSFLAVEMFAKIKTVFGIQIPLATLFRAATIETLAGVIRDTDLKQKWSSLVAIQPDGSKPPLFLVHGAGGNVLLYRDLANHLGPDQPVYGLQSKGLDGKQELLTRVEDMAAHYIKEMKIVQPGGPYLLGGYCLGGNIAYEIAKQLYDQGKKVDFVALFDTQRTWNEERIHIRLYQGWQKIIFHIKNFLKADFHGKILFFKEKLLESSRRSNRRLKVYKSIIAYKLKIRKERPLVIMEKVNDKSAIEYQANSYPGKITVFRPQETYAGYRDPMHGWGDSNTGEVEIVQLAMLPAGMLLEPFAEELAEKLNECLAKERSTVNPE